VCLKEQIGFVATKPEMTLNAKVELLERRVEALEKGEPNYQSYLKLKQQFEK